MAQTPVANSVQLCQVFQQNAYETPPLKRPKKKHGTPTGKNVVVLKRDDVLEKDGVVFMPNTIEMAQLKKSEKGQFKTNVQISSKMSEMDIKQILEESFPLLANRKFYCAGAADNRTRLDFHGERRIWDGRLIKQKIKGNSALYIFTNEELLGKQYPTGSKLAAPKRSYDQMTQTMKNERWIEAVGHSVGINQNFISTQSKSQTREPLLRTAQDMRAEANQSHSGLQGMVSPPLLPQMGSLTISHTASEWEKGQCAQATVGENIFMHAPWEEKEKQGEGNNSDSTVGKRFHPPIQSSVVNAQVNWAMDTACINKAVKVVGTSESDYESQLSDLAVERFTDSGFEASDGLRINDGSSETGFEPVFRDLPVPSNLSKDPCVDILNSQSGQDLPLDVNPPSSQLCNTEMLVQDIEETSSCGAADDVPAFLRDLFGTVQGICPSSGSVKGGFQFNITLDEALPEKVKGGEAHFEAVNVPVRKLNPFTLSGIVPSSQVPGTAAVTVITDSGQDLGFTFFEYIDDAEDWLKQLVEDRMLQSKYFALLSTKFAHGSSANTSNIAQGSSVQKMQQQSVKLLQLMVYTAAQTNAQEFIEMIFSTSAGQIVFNAYKDKTPLPEDVARENGHDELARYLQDIHARLAKEKTVSSSVIDWIELVQAVQKQSLTIQEESPIQLNQCEEDDDDSSDYFADAETSSCGSFDDDIGWPEISDNKEPCTHDEFSIEFPQVNTVISDNDDLPVKFPSKASFTKNESFIDGESTKGQTTSDDSSFVVKQGSPCLDTEEESEFSELPRHQRITPELLVISCEDPGKANSISTSELNMAKPKGVSGVKHNGNLLLVYASSGPKNQNPGQGASPIKQSESDPFCANSEKGQTSESSCDSSVDNCGYVETGNHETNGKPENQECGQGDVITSSWFTLLAEKTRRLLAFVVWTFSVLLASNIKNERITEGESIHEQTRRKDIGLYLKHYSSPSFEQLVLQLDTYPRPHRLPILHWTSCEKHGTSEPADACWEMWKKALNDCAKDCLWPLVEMETETYEMSECAVNLRMGIGESSLIRHCRYFDEYQKMFQDEDEKGNRLLTPLAGIFVSNSNKDIKIELSKLEPGWKIKGSNVKDYLDRPLIERNWKAIGDKLGVFIFRESHPTVNEICGVRVWRYRKLRRPETTLINLLATFNTWKPRKIIYLKLLIKEQQLLEREQLFALERLLAQKLSTKTKQFLNVRVIKRKRKFKAIYEAWKDPVGKQMNSYEKERKKIALAILFELFYNVGVAQNCGLS